MKTIVMADPVRFPRMTTKELRESFLLNALYVPGKINFSYVVDADRVVIGMAAPVDAPIALPAYPQLRAAYFTERRELGALNIGGSGMVRVGGKSYELNNLDVLYIGRGNAEVSFESKDKANPAIFYLLSYPAHAVYPVALVRKEDANPKEMGKPATTAPSASIFTWMAREAASW
jgi:4-deoxy-L-threo-5-hexosulose-uronate ketol-isomerase